MNKLKVYQLPETCLLVLGMMLGFLAMVVFDRIQENIEKSVFALAISIKKAGFK